MDVHPLKKWFGRPSSPATEDFAPTFAAIYEAQFERLYAYVRYRIGDPVAAEDLTADVFARLWSNRTHVRSPEAVVAWLFTTARNIVFDHYRRQHPTLPLDLVSPDVYLLSPSPEDQVLARERLELVLQGLAHLRVREREIVVLRFVAGLRNREIARILSIREGNVAKILHRTPEKLRVYMVTSSDPADR